MASWENYDAQELVSAVSAVQGEDESNVQLLSDALLYGTEIVIDTPNHELKGSVLDLISLGLEEAKAERRSRREEAEAYMQSLRSLPLRTSNKVPEGLPPPLRVRRNA